MATWTDWLRDAPRLLFHVTWTPLGGERFQPTNFPNLGAARYSLGGSNQEVVVVESPQSLVNRLEALSWDARQNRPTPLWQGLPYVEVVDAAGRFLTASRLEPHRLNGAWLRDGALADSKQGWIPYLSQRLDLAEGRPLDWDKVYAGIYALDPFCLVHGVFFADNKIPGQPKVARAITPTMDAYGAQEVVSGGVKKEQVVLKTSKAEKRSATEGYGFIPFPRSEFIAERIESRFVVDVEQIRSYALAERQTEILLLIALWEIRCFVDRPQRLRTFCDLAADEASMQLTLAAGSLPSRDQLEAAIRERIPAMPTQPIRLVHA